MTSEVQICSRALSRLGEPPITSLATGEGKNARICAAFYPQTRDMMLRSHRWKFAIKRQANLSASSTAPAFGYDRAFPVPADCLRVLSVNDLDPGLDPALDPTLWDREGNAIVTNEPAPLSIRYIARIEDPNSFDVSFITALEVALAQAMAPEIVAAMARAVVNDLEEEKLRTLREARGLSAIEGRPLLRRESTSSWLGGYRRV